MSLAVMVIVTVDPGFGLTDDTANVPIGIPGCQLRGMLMVELCVDPAPTLGIPPIMTLPKDVPEVRVMVSDSDAVEVAVNAICPLAVETSLDGETDPTLPDVVAMDTGALAKGTSWPAAVSPTAVAEKSWVVPTVGVDADADSPFVVTAPFSD